MKAIICSLYSHCVAVLTLLMLLGWLVSAPSVHRSFLNVKQNNQTSIYIYIYHYISIKVKSVKCLYALFRALSLEVMDCSLHREVCGKLLHDLARLRQINPRTPASLRPAPIHFIFIIAISFFVIIPRKLF